MGNKALSGTRSADWDMQIIAKCTTEVYKLNRFYIMHRGWMEKLGNRNGKWQRRYFLLVAPGFLVYFDSEEKAKEFEAIKIAPAVDGDYTELLQQCEPIIVGTFRYIPIRDHHDFRETGEWVGIANPEEFYPKPDCVCPVNGTHKKHQHVFQINGHCVRPRQVIAKWLACESDEERDAWVQEMNTLSQKMSMKLESDKQINPEPVSVEDDEQDKKPEETTEKPEESQPAAEDADTAPVMSKDVDQPDSSTEGSDNEAPAPSATEAPAAGETE